VQLPSEAHRQFFRQLRNCIEARRRARYNERGFTRKSYHICEACPRAGRHDRRQQRDETEQSDTRTGNLSGLDRFAAASINPLARTLSPKDVASSSNATAGGREKSSGGRRREASRGGIR
jgi:hypothetical protein